MSVCCCCRPSSVKCKGVVRCAGGSSPANPPTSRRTGNLNRHAYPSLPATPLACDHDHGDRRRDRMGGLRDAGQHAAAPDRDSDGAGRQRLRGGRQALPGGAREGRRGGATSLDRRNRCAAARSPCACRPPRFTHPPSAVARRTSRRTLPST